MQGTFNIMCALLVEKKLLTEKEGAELAEKLGNSMLPSAYKESQKLIRKILEKL